MLRDISQQLFATTLNLCQLGVGVTLGNGCTSGHGICGTAQRSPASWAATATFMAAAVAVTFLLTSFTGLGDVVPAVAK